MGRDPNTPVWAQHIAYKVKDRPTLGEIRQTLERDGIEALGVTDRSLFHSIYFFDPNGHRIERACPDPNEDRMLEELQGEKWEMLEEWSRTKRASQQPAWLHANELDKALA